MPERRRVRATLRALVRPYDKSAALLLVGALGLAACLAVETIGAMIVLEQGFVDAFYGASKTLVTVDPNDKVQTGRPAFKVFISVTMLTALVFEALFTAGIVNRLIDRRLTGIAGRRAVPRRDHVVVIGMGQVGLRLCLLLRRCGIGIVAVDDQESGENVGTREGARAAGGHRPRRRPVPPAAPLARQGRRARRRHAGRPRERLDRHGRALAQRGPADRAPRRRRAARQRDAVALPLGLVRDVHRIAAALLAARATGSRAARVDLPRGRRRTCSTTTAASRRRPSPRRRS